MQLRSQLFSVRCIAIAAVHGSEKIFFIEFYLIRTVNCSRFIAHLNKCEKKKKNRKNGTFFYIYCEKTSFTNGLCYVTIIIGAVLYNTFRVNLRIDLVFEHFTVYLYL